MTKRLAPLRRKGLIERQADPDGRRSSLVVLTKHGAAVFDQIMHQHYAQHLCAVLELSLIVRRQLADGLRSLLLVVQKTVDSRTQGGTLKSNATSRISPANGVDDA